MNRDAHTGARLSAGEVVDGCGRLYDLAQRAGMETA